MIRTGTWVRLKRRLARGQTRATAIVEARNPDGGIMVVPMLQNHFCWHIDDVERVKRIKANKPKGIR